MAKSVVKGVEREKSHPGSSSTYMWTTVDSSKTSIHLLLLKAEEGSEYLFFCISGPPLTPAIHIPYTWHGMLKVHMWYENIYNTSGRCLSVGVGSLHCLPYLMFFIQWIKFILNFWLSTHLFSSSYLIILLLPGHHSQTLPGTVISWGLKEDPPARAAEVGPRSHALHHPTGCTTCATGHWGLGTALPCCLASHFPTVPNLWIFFPFLFLFLFIF